MMSVSFNVFEYVVIVVCLRVGVVSRTLGTTAAMYSLRLETGHPERSVHNLCHGRIPFLARKSQIEVSIATGSTFDLSAI